jgi:rRNA-processing protein FCF1
MDCLDTYALVEIHNCNPVFSALLNDDFVITDITLAEFYGLLYRRHGRTTADYWLKKFESYAVRVETQTLMDAIRYRTDFAQENLSFFDCVGYMHSLAQGLMFLTGDKAFKNKKGVRFIK